MRKTCKATKLTGLIDEYQSWIPGGEELSGLQGIIAKVVGKEISTRLFATAGRVR